MKSITDEEARNWCRQAGLRLSKDKFLDYSGSKGNKFFVEAPEEFRKIVVLAREIIAFGGEVNFSGGLLLLRRWDIGSPQSVRAGWQIVEGLRRSSGDLRSLDVASGQQFRDDEFLQLHAFLLQVIGFGWVADFVPSVGGFFVHFKDNRQICFTAEGPAVLDELRRAFSRWNPTDQDPMVAKLAELERKRKR